MTSILTRRRTVIGLAVLTALLAGGAWWRAAWIANQLLRSWAAGIIAEKSGDVYRLDVGRIRFNFALRRIAVDSILLTTNRTLNTLQPRPLAVLRFAFRQCTISGVHLITLILNSGLIADSFGCRAVSVAVVVPPSIGLPDTLGQLHAAPRAFLTVQQSLRLPSFAPRVRIARSDFPHVSLDFRLQRARASAADTAVAARPLFSRTVELAAGNFVGHLDSATAVRVGALQASLTDSTLDARGIAFAPTVSDAAFGRSQRYRRGLIKTTVGRIAVQGIDVGAFVIGQGLRARRVELDSLRLDIMSDRRRASNPQRERRRTPQGWIANLGRTVSVDSVLIRHGEIVYRERRGDHDQAGVLTFARLGVVAVNVRHFIGRRTSSDSMSVSATAHLQNVGLLNVHFVVPLDAPRFDMSFRGTLGAMPAASFNVFIRETMPLRLTNGEVVGISFKANVTHGVANGSVTPRYNDLSVAVTRRGSTGMMGGGGILGGAARGIASLAGNWMKVRANNPNSEGAMPRSGTIRHTFTSDETLPAFLWASVRDGLLAVVRK
ncbi:MAG: hypothetical protein AUG50_07200 [Betaproteobacteria bacterium 13_1_20CM_3_63_8]|nr:MAG: hypothetical protein AUG50_07200 [Betaproteobacteria bacterium 13_1_20CM_3_63_8]